MAVTTSSVAKITFVEAEITFEVAVSTKSGGIQYTFGAVLYIFVFNRNTILCIYVKALDSKFQLISKMLLHFLNFGTHSAKI